MFDATEFLERTRVKLDRDQRKLLRKIKKKRRRKERARKRKRDQGEPEPSVLDRLLGLIERRKPSIDAVMRFKHKGRTVDAKVKRTKWGGGKTMTYVWVTMNGKIFETDGIPKDAIAIADV